MVIIPINLRRRPERRRRVLILVQNDSVPPDTRVWPEALALAAGGYEVHVICPRMNGCTLRRETIGGIRIYRYTSGPEARGTAGYILEYGIAIASQLTLALAIRARRRIDVVHICNPPDLLFLVSLPLTMLGARLIYDHHDACPELMMAKGHRAGSWQVRLTRVFERLTYRACDVSLETNESFRDIAIRRGGMRPEDVFVVRNAPPSTRFAAARADDRHRYGRPHMVAYVGMMAIQDGLDYLIDAVHIIIAEWQRRDIQFVLVGSGPELARLRDRVRRMNLADYVTFTGYIADATELGSVLVTADACVSPDPVNALNNISTMHKILEYMALGKPIVQFDLREGRISAGKASLYAAANDVTDFAKAIIRLIDDPQLRDQLGRTGRQRIAADLNWDAQVPRFLAGYERALRTQRTTRAAIRGRVDPDGRAIRRPPRRRACILCQNDHYDPSEQREAEALAQAGFDVEVICMRDVDAPRRAVVNGVKITRLPVSRRGASMSGKALGYGCFFLLAAGALAIRHLRRPYAVVQVNSMPDFLVFAALVPKLLGSKVVAYMQEPTPELATTVFGPTLLTGVLARIEQRAIRFADHTVTVTDQLRTRYVERGAAADRITVVLNGADPGTMLLDSSRPPARNKSGFQVVCHGTIEDRYGQDIIIDAARLLRAEMPDLRVVLTGCGSGIEQLIRTIADYGLHDMVRFEGWVSLARLNEILYSADIGVVAQKASPYSHLVHTNKMVDYWIFGLPVIASRLKAVSELYDDHFIEYFEPGNAAALAAAIRRLRADPSRRAELAQNGRLAQLSNGWATQRGSYLGVFDDLLGDVIAHNPNRSLALGDRRPTQAPRS